MQLLINKKANIHATDCHGCVPLHYAAQGGHDPSIQLLLRLKANCNAVDSHSLLPIHHAAKHNAVNAIKVILQKTSQQQLQTADENGKTPFLFSAENGALHAAKHFIEIDSSVLSQVDTGKKTAVHLAAQHGQLAMLKYLLEASADIEALTDDSKTAYDIAKESGDSQVIKFFKKLSKPSKRKGSASSPRSSPRKSRKKV